MRRLDKAILLTVLAAVAAAAPARAQRGAAEPPGEQTILTSEMPEEMQGADIIERRGAQTPMHLRFIGADGAGAAWADLFDGERPVVLLLGYYDCPLQCQMVFNNAQRAFNELDWTLGKEYRVVTISIDHTNTIADASERETTMRLGCRDNKKIPQDAWRFFVSDARSIKTLADSVGYKYVYVPRADEYSHPSAMIILSPDGEVSNYLINVKFNPRDLKLALLDAADGKIGSFFDGFLHRCFVYDPDAGGWSANARFIMSLSGAVTIVVLAAIIGVTILQARLRRNGLALAKAEGEAPAPAAGAG